MKKINGVVLYLLFIGLIAVIESKPHDEQPLSRIAIHKTIMALHESAYVKVSHSSLGSMGHHTDWVTVNFSNPNPSHDDWIGVFSPANFSAATCSPENPKVSPPLLCTAPIKYQYANYSSQDYIKTGKGSLALQMINQREDFSFALFSGGLTHPKLIAVSNAVAFMNPKAPVYPRLAHGKTWNEENISYNGKNLIVMLRRILLVNRFEQLGFRGAESNIRKLNALLLVGHKVSGAGQPGRSIQSSNEKSISVVGKETCYQEDNLRTAREHTSSEYSPDKVEETRDREGAGGPESSSSHATFIDLRDQGIFKAGIRSSASDPVDSGTPHKVPTADLPGTVLAKRVIQSDESVIATLAIETENKVGQTEGTLPDLVTSFDFLSCLNLIISTGNDEVGVIRKVTSWRY